MALEFSAMHLIVGDKTASMSDFSPIIEEDSHRHLHGNSVYKVDHLSDGETYWWSSFRYGDRNIYSEDVANLNLGIDEANPRLKYQVELSKQLFCLYDARESCLYISDARKKSFIAHYLKAKLDKQVVIKNFYKSVDDFLNIIRNVESVTFTAKRNLFSVESGVTKVLPSPGDMYGLGMPEAFTLEAKFQRASLTDKFRQLFKTMSKWTQDMQAEKLVCIGMDDSGVEAVFNTDKFVQKTEINARPNEHGSYDPEQVRLGLMTKLGIG